MPRAMFVVPLVSAGMLLAACGDTRDDRMVTGGLGGAATGALIAGPVGAIIGGTAGAAGGAALNQSVDEEINDLANRATDDDAPVAQASDDDRPAM